MLIHENFLEDVKFLAIFQALAGDQVSCQFVEKYYQVLHIVFCIYVHSFCLVVKVFVHMQLHTRTESTPHIWI